MASAPTKAESSEEDIEMQLPFRRNMYPKIGRMVEGRKIVQCI